MTLFGLVNKLPIGTIIQGIGTLDNKWHKCDGSVLAKADYPDYVYAASVDLHPKKWANWDVISLGTQTQGRRYALDSINDYVIAVGNGSVVNYSSDGGLTWDYVSPFGSSDNYYSIANNGSRFVTVKYNSTTAWYSDDYGESWTSVVLPVSGTWRNILYNGSKWLICKSDNTLLNKTTDKFLISDDGITWTSTGTLPLGAPTTDYYVTRVVNGKFVIALTNSGQTYYSTDGSTWSGGTSHNFMLYEFDRAGAYDICYFRNKYWLFFDEERNYCLTSDDALIWDYYSIKNICRDVYGGISGYAILDDCVLLFSAGSPPYNLLVSSNDAPHVWNAYPGPFKVLLGQSSIAYRNNGDSSWILLAVDTAGMYNNLVIRAIKISQYDMLTHFQLPLYNPRLSSSGVYHYIKMKY